MAWWSGEAWRVKDQLRKQSISSRFRPGDGVNMATFHHIDLHGFRVNFGLKGVENGLKVAGHGLKMHLPK